ncbi:hypothetical protein CEXT_745221 [Caerostris extrusa]|uniref:Uncharacterized protein n=1 Tax=Caerostris extrusa TaxID=172846 RepID=A0AAV4R352_CAEEX|nr:hypothetical protein CEXT_745221 [Caerostris extrusa]
MARKPCANRHFGPGSAQHKLAWYSINAGGTITRAVCVSFAKLHSTPVVLTKPAVNYKRSLPSSNWLHQAFRAGRSIWSVPCPHSLV